MYYYLILVLVVIIFCYLEYDEKKSDYKQAKELNEQFKAWIKSGAKTSKPSNAVFTKLYKKRYGTEVFTQEVIQQKSDIIGTDRVDVTASFPSLNPNILDAEIKMTNNLESYYKLQYEEVRTLKYTILFALSLPLRLLKYIGIDKEKNTSKLFQIIFWIVSLFEPQIASLLLKLLSSILNNK